MMIHSSCSRLTGRISHELEIAARPFSNGQAALGRRAPPDKTHLDGKRWATGSPYSGRTVPTCRTVNPVDKYGNGPPLEAAHRRVPGFLG